MENAAFLLFLAVRTSAAESAIERNKKNANRFARNSLPSSSSSSPAILLFSLYHDRALFCLFRKNYSPLKRSQQKKKKREKIATMQRTRENRKCCISLFFALRAPTESALEREKNANRFARNLLLPPSSSAILLFFPVSRSRVILSRRRLFRKSIPH